MEKPISLSFMKFASDEMHALFLDMLKRHKTVMEVDNMAVREQWLVNCPSCDGSRVKIWQRSDEEYKCDIWSRAEKLGLTNGL